MDAFIRGLASSADELKSIRFTILIIGVAGDILVLFIPSSKKVLERSASVVFIIVIILGIWIDHIGDRWATGPRSLTDKQRERLVAELTPFSGQIFQMITYPNCDECSDTFMLVYNALITAGWAREGPPVGIPIGAQQTILVHVSDEASDRTKGAGGKLASALNEKGIAAKIMMGGTANTQIVDIIIGLKP
jgi:hypothetical protein